MFNFEPVVKSKNTGGTPDGCLRIKSNEFVISSTATGNMVSTQRPSRSAITSKVSLAIAYDPNAKALKINSDENGFVCSLYPNGSIVGRIPVKLEAMNPPVGDYKLVEGMFNVFQLVQ